MSMLMVRGGGVGDNGVVIDGDDTGESVGDNGVVIDGDGTGGSVGDDGVVNRW